MEKVNNYGYIDVPLVPNNTPRFIILKAFKITKSLTNDLLYRINMNYDEDDYF